MLFAPPSRNSESAHVGYLRVGTAHDVSVARVHQKESEPTAVIRQKCFPLFQAGGSTCPKGERHVRGRRGKCGVIRSDHASEVMRSEKMAASFRPSWNPIAPTPLVQQEEQAAPSW